MTKSKTLAYAVVGILGLVTIMSLLMTYHIVLVLIALAAKGVAIDATLITLLPVVSGTGGTALGGLMTILVATERAPNTPAPVEVTNTPENPIPAKEVQG